MSADDWTPGEAALDLVCPFCGALYGETCQTFTTRQPAPTHMARMQPLFEAFAAGYDEGRADGRNVAAREARRG